MWVPSNYKWINTCKCIYLFVGLLYFVCLFFHACYPADRLYNDSIQHGQQFRCQSLNLSSFNVISDVTPNTNALMTDFMTIIVQAKDAVSPVCAIKTDMLMNNELFASCSLTKRQKLDFSITCCTCRSIVTFWFFSKRYKHPGNLQNMRKKSQKYICLK